MTRLVTILCFVLGIGIAATAGPNEVAKGAPVRLLLSEVQAGTMAPEHYCALLFANRPFHYERAIRKTGKDRDRKGYEGEFSETEWDALGGILGSKEIRELNVPQGLT